jgi:hypothetical protein
MPRIEVDTGQLSAVATEEAAVAAQVIELRGRVEALATQAASAAGHAGAGAAIGDCGLAWTTSLGGLANAVSGIATNMHAAADAYAQTDAGAIPAP